jgi:DNA-binding PadR family transcriptional regulator
LQEEPRLNPTSYIVLGLLAQAGEATPYDLKRAVAAGVGNFWSLQHAQLYSEPERLARAGYVTEDRESTGRRRRRYSITAKGRRALKDWLAAPAHGFTELRDPGLLKLFFGADPAELAAGQVEIHRRQLERYEELRAASSGAQPSGPLHSLDAGIAPEREWVRFWKRLAP